MKKAELKTLATYFGNTLPVWKIKNRETRLAIVGLYSSLAGYVKDIDEEIESIRKAIVGDKQADVDEYVKRMQEGRQDEADEMTDCVAIEQDFNTAVSRIYSEEIDANIRKVSLETLYEALSDCEFPGFNEGASIMAVSFMFAPVIKD